jgi:hypothetical protein
MGLPLYVICFFSLTAFNILSLVSVLVVLVIICHGVVLFWSNLFDVLVEQSSSSQAYGAGTWWAGCSFS